MKIRKEKPINSGRDFIGAGFKKVVGTGVAGPLFLSVCTDNKEKEEQ
ncbi:MAG TPA: hypothetical protein VK766_07055 [Cytophagaceae bacterium]|jgi:hypothetical protein|nr:hypothetical protein [Cytophagaceae bacterium]